MIRNLRYLFFYLHDRGFEILIRLIEKIDIFILSFLSLRILYRRNIIKNQILWIEWWRILLNNLHYLFFLYYLFIFFNLVFLFIRFWWFSEIDYLFRRLYLNGLVKYYLLSLFKFRLFRLKTDLPRSRKTGNGWIIENQILLAKFLLLSVFHGLVLLNIRYFRSRKSRNGSINCKVKVIYILILIFFAWLFYRWNIIEQFLLLIYSVLVNLLLVYLIWFFIFDIFLLI